MGWIVLATEDELSEQVGVMLAGEAGLSVDQCLRKQGFGYLRKRMGSFCQMAENQPVVVITDLDQSPCPSHLRDSWLGNRHMPVGLLFRVAVREIEAWLLADRSAMHALLRVAVASLPRHPDSLPDPKEALLHLARRAPREIREDLIARRGSIAGQGLGYNARLSEFVRKSWDPQRASALSPSLARARTRLRELSISLEK